MSVLVCPDSFSVVCRVAGEFMTREPGGAARVYRPRETC